MSRQRWIWDKSTGRLAEAKDYIATSNGPMISPDIAPYSCPITGKVIDGRMEHRENLARHDCRILEKGEVEHDRKRRSEDMNARLDQILGL